MTYYSAVKLPPVIPTPAGSHMTPVFSLVEDKETGVRSVEQTGEHDLYAEVQACRADCDMTELIKRYERGDNKALDIKQAFYGDLTDLEGYSMAEAHNSIEDLRQAFLSSGKTFRAAFDNSFDRFIRLGGVAPQKQQQQPAEPAQVKEVEQ